MAADNSSCSNPDGHFQDDTNIDGGLGDSPLKHMLEGDDPVCSVQEKNGKYLRWWKPQVLEMQKGIIAGFNDIDLWIGIRSFEKFKGCN